MRNLYFFTVFSVLLHFGSFGQVGLDFDGYNDYIQTEYPGIDADGSRTVEAWVKMSTDYYNRFIVDMGDFGTGNGARFSIKLNGSYSNVLRIEIGGGGLNGTQNITDNSWHHIAVVYDNSLATNKYKIYVDGVLDVEGDISNASGIIPLNTPNNLSPMTIGARTDHASNNNFDGILDEVRVWNVARTQTQLVDNMNNELCSFDPELVSYFRLNEGSPVANNSAVDYAVDEITPSSLNPLVNFGLTSTSGYSNYVTGKAISNENHFETSLISCEPYYWSETGMTYDVSGVYTATYTNQYGCDSTYTLDLNIPVLDLSVNDNLNGSLSSVMENVNYQWLACDNNDAMIANATGPTFFPATIGNYAVEINNQGCIDTSLCVAITSIPDFVNTALHFNGSSNRVTTETPGIAGDAARTVESWIKIPSDNPNSQGVITDWGTLGAGTRFTFNLLNQKLRIEFEGGGINGKTLLNDNKWHHVAVTYNPDDNDTVRLFVDGIQDTAAVYLNTINTGASNNISIGGRMDNVNFFTGSIDEVRVWDSALTEAEIFAGMNETPCSFTEGLVAHFKFNEGEPFADNTAISYAIDYGTQNAKSGNLQSLALIGGESNYVDGPNLSRGYEITYLDEIACDSYTWNTTSTQYTGSGFYAAELTTSDMCDSLVFLDLTINHSVETTLYASECSSYTWDENGFTYSLSGVYSEVYGAANGCDSIITLNLTILETSSETVVTDCDSYFWDANGMTYDATGIYTATLMNAAGCDSNLTLDLTIEAPVATVTLEANGNLTCDQAGMSYQWLNCTTDQVISGENTISFTPEDNGTYAVIINTPNNCSDTSECVTFSSASSEEQSITYTKVYPNPSQGRFNVNASVEMNGTIKIMNSQGQVIEERTVSGTNSTEFDLTGLASGIYYILIEDNSFIETLRVSLSK